MAQSNRELASRAAPASIHQREEAPVLPLAQPVSPLLLRTCSLLPTNRRSLPRSQPLFQTPPLSYPFSTPDAVEDAVAYWQHHIPIFASPVFVRPRALGCSLAYRLRVQTSVATRVPFGQSPPSLLLPLSLFAALLKYKVVQ